MMKKLFFSILFFSACILSNAQTYVGRQLVETFARSASAQTYALTWLPLGYNNTGNKRYPLIINGHGAGEYANAFDPSYLTKLITPSKTLPQQIAAGWNATAYNVLTGQVDSFIVVTPQYYNTGWAYDYTQWKFILPDIISRYRVDTSRIYATGLSAGGGGIFTIFGSNDTTFIKKFAAFATASSAGVNAANGFTAIQVEANLRNAAKYGVRAWTIAGEQDYLLNTDVRYHDSMNKLNLLPPSKLTVIQGVGHSSWTKMFDTLFRPQINYYGNTGNCQNGCNNGGISVMPNNNGSAVRGSGVTQDSLNVFEWLLLNSRTFPNSPVPDADAGSDQSITLPNNSVTLNGSGSSGGTGETVTGWLWEQKSGPPCTIQSPGSMSTLVSGLTAGNYIFSLTVTNGIGLKNTDNVLIRVNGSNYSHPTITLTSPATQNITTTTATVSATGTTTNSAVKRVTWRKLKVPGQTAKKVVAIGSSTFAGTGANPMQDSAVYPIIMQFANAHNLVSTSTNLSLGGTSIFQAMPSSYIPGPGEDSPDPARNITAALALNPDIVLIFYPSNDYDGLTTSQVIFAYKTIFDSTIQAGKRPVIFTTLPRQAFGTAAQLRLAEIDDSLFLHPVMGSYVVRSHEPVTDYDRQTALYNWGDNIHQNNTGHRVVAYNGIAGINWIGQGETSSAVITNPNSLTTTITNLTNGEHKFLVTLEDGHGQIVYKVTTINVTLESNQLPTANAGSDQIITLPVSSVNLSGSGSDIDGTISSYHWQKISGPGTTLIPNPGNQNVTASNLQAGTYVFQLTVTDNDGGQGFDQITVTVNPEVISNCVGNKYTAVPGGDLGYYNVFDLGPKDTLLIPGNVTFSYIYIDGKKGRPDCPIVIINGSGGVAKLKANNLEIRNCEYVKVTGSGSADYYGFEIDGHGLDTLRNSVFGIKIRGRSRCIEVERVFLHNLGIGIEVKQDPDCDPQYQYPNWVMDSIFLHHNKVVDIWNEGFYIGNTSPDNSAESYSPRPVVCGGITTYPRPIRLGHIYVDSNIVIRTGRSAIQFSSVSEGFFRIGWNQIKNGGMNGDPAQGQGIVIGAYCGNGLIIGNNVDSTYTHSIASIGGAGTTGRIEMIGNITNNAGNLRAYNLSTSPPGTTVIISQEPKYNNTLNWPYAFFMQTVTHQDPGYSANFTINNNQIGSYKQQAIGLFDMVNMMGSNNNICGNTSSLGQPININVEGSTTVQYFLNCIQVKRVIKSIKKIKFRNKN